MASSCGCAHTDEGWAPAPDCVNECTRWDRDLALCGSEDRARVLLSALEREPDPGVRRILLRDWFNSCDAIGDCRRDIRGFFELAEWVTDTEEVPTFPITVYRAAWDDDDVDSGLSWTTDLVFAEKFARGLISPRAMFLGIYRKDSIPTIWRATCLSAFAFFNSREESEVIPAELEDIEKISQLVNA